MTENKKCFILVSTCDFHKFISNFFIMTSFEKRGQSIGRSIDNGINTAKQTVDKVGSAIRRGHEAAVDATSKAIESTAEAGRKVAD